MADPWSRSIALASQTSCSASERIMTCRSVATATERGTLGSVSGCGASAPSSNACTASMNGVIGRCPDVVLGRPVWV
jgi:hypothetical protein